MTSASAKDLAERLRDEDIPVSRALNYEAAALLTRYAEVEGELETTGDDRAWLSAFTAEMGHTDDGETFRQAKLIFRILRDITRLTAQVVALKEERGALVKERDWLIECNGRASVRAERAEDNEEVSLRLRDQAQADAAKFLERANDLGGKYDALLTTWTESRERHLEAEAALAELRGRVEKARKLASRKVHELGSNPVTALADVAAILSPEGEAKREATSTEALGRFGHHPDPAIDFEVEVGDIEGSAYEAIAGHLDRTALLDRAERALSFRVGAVESCINAKATLRKIVADLKAPTLAQLT